MRSEKPKGILKIALQRHAENYPLHAGLIGLMTWVENERISTCCVGYDRAGLLFQYNPKFTAEIKLSELEGVIHHEINHVLLGHLDSKGPHENPTAMMLAEEITVNEWVAEPLPGRPILLSDFPKLKPNEDTLTRYELLKKEDLSSYEHLLKEPHFLVPLEGQDADFARALLKSEIAVILSGPQSEALNDLLRQVWGDQSAGLSRQVLRDKKRGTVNWISVLRHFVGSLNAPAYCATRPSRRLPELLGLVPGRLNRPGKISLMAVIDTSGSIDEFELAAIARELNSLKNVAEMLIVECDADVKRTYRFQGGIENVLGGGGTDFRPALEKEFLGKHRPDLVVYFTDGYGAAPKHAPAVPVVWCLSANGRKPATWGRVIKMAKLVGDPVWANI